MIDNRNAPPVDEAWARASGKNPIGAGVKGTFEAPVLTCSHCQRQMMVQPLRTRERAYCRKCDHYICDECALIAKLNGGECEPLNAKLDRKQEALLRSPLLL